MPIQLIQTVVETYRILTKRYPSYFGRDLGATLNNYGYMLGQAGREQDAITTLRESILVWREIPPESTTVTKETTTSLMALASWLDKTGDHVGALDANHEALQIIQETLPKYPEELADIALQIRIEYIQRGENASEDVDKSLIDSLDTVLIATKRLTEYTFTGDISDYAVIPTKWLRESTPHTVRTKEGNTLKIQVTGDTVECQLTSHH